MGYPTKVQLIQRKKGPDQWYINIPTAVAEAMDFSKGEVVEWHMEDRGLLAISRLEAPASVLKKNRRVSSKSSKRSCGRAAGSASRSGSGKKA